MQESENTITVALPDRRAQWLAQTHDELFEVLQATDAIRKGGKLVVIELRRR